MEPLPAFFDETCCTNGANHPRKRLYHVYSGNRPCRRRSTWPEGQEFDVEVIDTWNMTITRQAATAENSRSTCRQDQVWLCDW